MMRVIDVLADPVTQRAAYQHVRQIMLTAGKASEADRAGDSISSNLHHAVIVILIGDHGGKCPRLDAVAGWKRRSAVKKIATSGRRHWTPPLSNLFNRSHQDR